MFHNLASMIATLADPAWWLASPAMVACVIITLIGLPLLFILAKAMPILDRPAAIVPVPACTRAHQKTRRGLASLYRDQRATATIASACTSSTFTPTISSANAPASISTSSTSATLISA